MRFPLDVRYNDYDAAGHVNNAVYWTAVEEDLRVVEAPLVAEVERRGAALDGDAVVRRDGDRWWVCAPDGQIHASFAVGGRTVDA